MHGALVSPEVQGRRDVRGGSSESVLHQDSTMHSALTHIDICGNLKMTGETYGADLRFDGCKIVWLSRIHSPELHAGDSLQPLSRLSLTLICVCFRSSSSVDDGRSTVADDHTTAGLHRFNVRESMREKIGGIKRMNCGKDVCDVCFGYLFCWYTSLHQVTYGQPVMTLINY